MYSENTLETTRIYSSNVIDVECLTVELINGNRAERIIVRHNGGACVVAIDDENNVYLVRQFRKPLDAETLEIPAGKLEKGEDPLACAIRELREETGLLASRVESIGYIYPTPGFCDEKLYLYIARGLTQTNADPDPDEFVNCEKYPLTHCLRMIESGEITDSKTVVAIYKTARILGMG